MAVTLEQISRWREQRKLTNRDVHGIEIKIQGELFDNIDELLALAEAGLRKESNDPVFPMQDGPPIPRSLAAQAYSIYSVAFGTGQSLDRLAERGGFGWEELAILFAGKQFAAARRLLKSRS